VQLLQAIDRPPLEPVSLREIATMLVKRYGLHEGLWDLSVEFQVGIGPMGPSPSDILPGAMFRLSRIGLAPAIQPGPQTVDAAVVNPAQS